MPYRWDASGEECGPDVGCNDVTSTGCSIPGKGSQTRVGSDTFKLIGEHKSTATYTVDDATHRVPVEPYARAVHGSSAASLPLSSVCIASIGRVSGMPWRQCGYAAQRSLTRYFISELCDPLKRVSGLSASLREGQAVVGSRALWRKLPFAVIVCGMRMLTRSRLLLEATESAMRGQGL